MINSYLNQENMCFDIEYSVNGNRFTTNSSNKDLEIIINKRNNLMNIDLKINKPMFINKFSISLKYEFDDDSLFFANGFQSWTDTQEFCKNDKMDDLGVIGKSFIGKKLGLNYVGDYNFVNYGRNNGVFHSHSYTYIRQKDQYHFIGSLSDRNGYTIFKCNMNNNSFSIFKDIEGVLFKDGQVSIVSLIELNGGYDDVFDEYFKALNIKPLTDEKLKGYTTWYNYYENINEDIIKRDLEALTNATKEINVFQIDDGYQSKVGEWLSLKEERFPNGMKIIADSIHDKGLKAGIWIAPFAVQKDSKILKNHPDWIVRQNGKPFMVGANWGGFYPLDIYNEEARAYIKNFFNVILNQWGFDLVKLDFLYAASVIPNHNKSRGQIMYEAIDLLRECVGDKQILGCGVQMMPCFGVVDYMRIGADMGLSWKPDWKRKFMHREDVSTKNAIKNSLYRRHLNQRAFLSDTDVFLLRDYNISFTFEQRKLLARIIKLLGSVLFTSDDVSKYNKEQLKAMNETFEDEDIKITNVIRDNNIYTIEYLLNKKTTTLKFNMDTGEQL